MGPDIEVSQSGSVGQREPQRGFESALSASGFEDVGDGAGAEGVAFEGECDGGGQLLLPVVVEQGESGWRSGAAPLPVRRDARRAWRWRGRRRGGGRGWCGRWLAGGGEQVSQMGGVLDGQPGVVGAVMVGQLGLSVEDADAGGAGDQGQRLSDVGVGNRVEIAVEADVGSLAGADDAHQVGLEGMGGQRQQAGLFFGPDVGDTAVGLVGVTPPVGDLVSPAAELGVDVVEVAEGAGGEEGVP